ncbi:MAG: aminoglycoside phosphotransferase family protein [Propionibacteriaceae bacterium]|jgi:Ser/Thr protein kinase RdoA (MazF antagonist)|nr:aminoglycoside phosphotransferase family protein [Propionibacteriaceae bacterium]
METCPGEPADAAGREELAAFVAAEYGLEAVALTPAERGFYGQTWRLETRQGAAYFLKLVYWPSHQRLYRDSFAALVHLAEHGVDFIGRVRPTTAGDNYSWFGQALLGVFDWCPGEQIDNDDTKAAEYALLARVYTVPLAGLEIARAEFSDRAATDFYHLLGQVRDPALTALFVAHRAVLATRAGRLDRLARLCAPDETHFYLTHGDAGGNLIVGPKGCFLVDWDSVRLAPPERDGWVMGYKPWARALFDRKLAAVGLDYSLRSERLAYFAHHFWFEYMTEYLTRFLETGTAPPPLLDYFTGWVEERVRCAWRLVGGPTD